MQRRERSRSVATLDEVDSTDATQNLSLLASTQYNTPYTQVCRERLDAVSRVTKPKKAQSSIFSSFHEKLSSVIRHARNESAPAKQKSNANTSQANTAAEASNVMTSNAKISSILPDASLKELCLKLLTQRVERQSVMEAKTAQRLKILRAKRALAMKFKASVNAVSFTSIITKQRLERLAKKLDHFSCDPYVVMPGMLLDLGITCGRQLCHFRLRLEIGGMGTELSSITLRFIIDSCPINDDGSQEEWRVWLVSEQDTILADEHFVNEDDVCVLGKFDDVTETFVPSAVDELKPTIGPHYHIIRDLEKSIQATLAAELAQGQEEARVDSHEDVHKLLEIFAVPLPKYEELAILPIEVQEAINKLGIEIMRRYLYPRLILKLRRKARIKSIRTTYIAPMTVENMQKQSIFASWPPSVLQDAVRSLLPLVVDRGEYIIHEDENAGSGIFFLVSGTVEVLKKTSRASKSIGPDNTKVLVTLGPPACFGEFAFLTEDPRMATVKAVTHCTLWQMEKEDFHRLFQSLPPSVINEIQTVAFKKRTANMLNTYPLNTNVLAEYSLFSKCNKAVLQRVIPAIRPFAVPKGTIICKADEAPKVIFFLRRGKCGVFRYVRERREDIHILTLNVPAVMADDAVIFNSTHTTTIKALTNCDLYILPKDDFEAIMANHPKQWEIILGQASASRQAKLNQSQFRYKEMAVSLPFVSTLLPLNMRVELMHEFLPVVYHPRQVVCSAANFADRVVIVVEGSVRFENGQLWEQGESAGFTCVVPHRWQQSAVSRGTSKIIEITLEKYVEFLKRHGVYETVVERVKALMFPKAANPNTLFSAILETQDLKNPPMYPISDSKVVNLHEPRFGLRVMTYGKKEKSRVEMDPLLTINHDETAQEIHAKEFVSTALSKIETRAAEKQKQKGIVKVHPLRDGRKNWSRGGALMYQREKVDPRRPSVSNHPLLEYYRQSPLAPLDIQRPRSAQH